MKNALKYAVAILVIALIASVITVICLAGQYGTLSKKFQTYQDSVKKSDTHTNLEHAYSFCTQADWELQRCWNMNDEYQLELENSWRMDVVKDSIIFADIPKYSTMYNLLYQQKLVVDSAYGYPDVNYDSLVHQKFWKYLYKNNIVKQVKY